MQETLEIKKEATAGSIRITVAGRIDAYWSDHLEKILQEEINAGHYALVLDFAELSYISSAGIRIIIGCYKQLQSLHGSFSLINASGNVASVLKMSGLSSLLKEEEGKKEEAAAQEKAAGDADRINISVRKLDAGASFRCTIVGKPEALFLSGYSPDDSHRISLRKTLFGIGAGAIGADFDSCRNRFGEFIALAGAAAYRPTDGSNRPDYILSAGTYEPELMILYGILWEGGFSHIADFEFPGTGGGAALGDLIEDIISAVPGMEQAAIAIIGETSGLVGAALSRSPLVCNYHAGESPFTFPGIRDNLYFTTEKIHRRTLSVTAGIVCRADKGSLKDLTRPLSVRSKLRGHFHAAVLPFRPLRKQMTDVSGAVRMLYDEGQIMDVLHLMNDERDISGIGESGFIRGSCWIGSISEISEKR